MTNKPPDVHVIAERTEKRQDHSVYKDLWAWRKVEKKRGKKSHYYFIVIAERTKKRQDHSVYKDLWAWRKVEKKRGKKSHYYFIVIAYRLDCSTWGTCAKRSFICQIWHVQGQPGVFSWRHMTLSESPCHKRSSLIQSFSDALKRCLDPHKITMIFFKDKKV